ncbi:MAG: DUF3455 domain-containing protein [Bryobacteraceae bacterium]
MRAFVLAAMAACACCGQTGGSFIPEKLEPPAGEKRFLTLQAKGDQIYTCRNANGNFAWSLKAPDAQLFEGGKQVGRHFAGPTWALSDGSSVVGKAAVMHDSPDSGSIPWLLVSVVSRSGQGALTQVSHIQRIDTKGGKAPGSGCDAAKVGSEIRAPYSATYVFFK